MNVRSSLLLASAALLFTACTDSKTSSLNLDNKNTSIVNGSAALPQDRVTASTVALIAKYDGKPYSFCTGTLISEDLVLTASHCLEYTEKPSDVWIFFGTDLPKELSDTRLLTVENFERHSGYEMIFDDTGYPVTGINDVAVIRLQSKAPAGTLVVPVLAPETQLEEGQSLLLAGYGLIDDVKGVRSDGLNYTQVPLAKVWETILVTDQLRSGACSGDSGGPAYLESKDGLIVAGITRGPHDKAPDCHTYGEYTYASKHKQFILEAAKKLGAQEPQFVDLK
ncbi:hypothetical protein AZI87_09040 [Bdellovibrio bacteriovorus]|uniref:Peptidase S1 domain-containing protein n=1 Tax=Bdellovibrio bacteriovorus TaxID=959 RepID=A0A162GZW5_BDEBC|nr:trypsin-like serine protease [Bdellovibrio bacteriovorus]KYG69327.1 hypothetical protein AZI87_09040 [Bdellovibrio bacteriovorus]